MGAGSCCHQAEQAERECDAEITEDDILDDDREPVPAAATDELVEVAPPDIRETAVPNATEKTDAAAASQTPNARPLEPPTGRPPKRPAARNSSGGPAPYRRPIDGGGTEPKRLTRSGLARTSFGGWRPG